MRRMLRALAALALGIGVLSIGSPAAHGDGTALLGVYEAESAASPIGVISKVPAETDGGVVFASSLVELGKAQATAAGATLGPLGDAFVQTSVPGFTNPTFVTAQYPPSPVFPAQATATTALPLGPVSGLTFHGVADASPSATADATAATAALTGLLTARKVSSHSSTAVLNDGTVETSANSTITGLAVGPAGVPLLTISTMTSTASVSVPLNGKITKSVTVEMGGVLLGGVPVDITQSGIDLAGSLPVPATGVSNVNAALAALAGNGLFLQVVPVTQSEAPGTASVSGAALEIGYQVPASLENQLPTNIGGSETVLLGEVTATATARAPIGLPPAPAPAPVSVSAPASSGPLVSPSPAPAPSSAPAPLPGVAPATTPPPSTAKLFTLPPRAQDLAATRFRSDYRIFILVGLIAIGALVVCARNRLVS